MPWAIVNDTGKLFSNHTLCCSGSFYSQTDWRKIEVKIIISFVHKLTTYTLKILPLYFTEIWLPIKRSETSCSKRYNLCGKEVEKRYENFCEFLSEGLTL